MADAALNGPTSLAAFEGLAARLDLPEIGVVLPMAEIYEDTAVAPVPQAASS